MPLMLNYCSAHSSHSANEKVANENTTASFNKQAMSTVNGSSNVSTHHHSSTRYEEHIAYEKTEEYYDEYVSHDSRGFDRHSSYAVRRRHQIESLGAVLSEVPWMKFRVIAEPDMSIFMKDTRIHALIQNITKKTVTSVRTQIHEEFKQTISRTMEKLVHEMTKTVDTHMSRVEMSVAEQFRAISSVKAVTTATVCQALGKNGHLCTCDHHVHDHHPPCPSVPTPPESPVNHPAVKIPPPNFSKAIWIWSKDAKDKYDVPGCSRTFRKTLNLPSSVDFATIDISCDNLYTLYVNGKLVGSGKQWYKPDRWTVRFEHTKKVVVAVFAAQDPDTEGYVGLLVSGKTWNSQEKTPQATEFVTNNTWLTLSSEPSGSGDFIKTDFVDSSWESAWEQKKAGDGYRSGMVEPQAGRLPKQALSGLKNIKDAPKALLADVVFPAASK